MKKTLIAVFAFFAVISVAGAEGAKVNFDGGKAADFVSLKQTVQNASEGLAIAEPGVAERWGNKPYWEPEKRCYDLRLIDKDGTSPSWWIELSSDYFEFNSYDNAWDWTRKMTMRYEISFSYRELRNGETEFFKVCHNFPLAKSTYEVVSSPFNYEIKTQYLPNNQSGFTVEFLSKGRRTRGESSTPQVFEQLVKPAELPAR